jgi:hypothetical protein
LLPLLFMFDPALPDMAPLLDGVVWLEEELADRLVPLVFGIVWLDVAEWLLS